VLGVAFDDFHVLLRDVNREVIARVDAMWGPQLRL
jgi:hypothetical protein